MAVGKNKKLGKARKGGRRRAADPFLKKEWYDIRTPACFPVKSAGKTIATKTQGIKIARDTLMGRIVEVSLGDLKEDTEQEAFRKFKLRVEDVNGFNVLTQFYGMDVTTDKLRSLVRKWQTLIECHVDIRTSDGYSCRLFAIGFTQRHKDHGKKTAYASSAQQRAIRRRMKEVISRETASVDLHQLVDKLMLESIGKEIFKHTQAIYPLQNCLIRKVKMLRSPKVDAQKLIEAAGGAEELGKTAGHITIGKPAVVAASSEDTGAKVAAPKGKKEAKAPAAEPKDATMTDAPAAAPASAEKSKEKPAPKADKKPADKKASDKADKKADKKAGDKADKKAGDKADKKAGDKADKKAGDKADKKAGEKADKKGGDKAPKADKKKA